MGKTTRTISWSCYEIYTTTHSSGMSITSFLVLFSRSAIRSNFHCKRNTCHDPKKNVVTGMIRSHSFRFCPAPGAAA